MIFIAKSSLTIGPKNVPSEFSCKISFHMNPVLIGKLHDTFLAARMVGVCHQSHTGVESGVISWNVFLIFAHSCAKMGKFDTVDLRTGGLPRGVCPPPGTEYTTVSCKQFSKTKFSTVFSNKVNYFQ